MSFYNVFLAIFTLFIVGITGFVSRRIGIMTKEMADNIPKFITHVTMPAMFLTSMQLTFSWDRLAGLGYILGTALVAYSIQFLAAFLIPRLLGESGSPDKGVYQFMMIFSNAAFMGFPVLNSIFGQEAVFYGAVFNLPFNALVFTLGVYIMQKEKGSFKARQLVSPALIATIIGMMFFIFSIKIPGMINQPLSMIGDMTTPLSMIFIGASLSEVTFGGIFLKGKLYVVALFRLLLIPLVLLMILKPFVSDPIILGVPVVIMAMPVAALCSIIAKSYDNNVELAAEGTFITTTLSMITIPFVVWILTII
ncbi:AEC family transporter [Alkalibacter mobilis]|uniref:AEC family transporter n=1 Tax=Alkalibacter mobilis TaxID=2787712 RepID=UPI0018A0C800|nr:AEC family transporter [Alkalibacter mobilis]MBF7096713.1 AEC family transporter [Alkalibacter mobilis]